MTLPLILSSFPSLFKLIPFHIYLWEDSPYQPSLPPVLPLFCPSFCSCKCCLCPSPVSHLCPGRGEQLLATMTGQGSMDTTAFLKTAGEGGLGLGFSLQVCCTSYKINCAGPGFRQLDLLSHVSSGERMESWR